MKRSSSLIIIICFLIFQNLPAQTNIILDRYRQYLFQNFVATDKISELMASLNSKGQWPDIDYENKERGGWSLLSHMKRLRDLSLAYADPRSAFFHQPALLQTINLGLDYWVQNRFQCPNWWHNEIGVPQQMRDVLVVLGAALIPPRFAGALEIMAQYKIHQNSTGANLTWSADLGLHYGALTNNAALMQTCRDQLIGEIKITTDDGVQPDYSFHQHGKRLQMYQYGAAFLKENIRIAWELRRTTLAFPKEKIALLTDFTFQGWQWMARGINTVPGTMDRSASRKDALRSADIRELIPLFSELAPGITKKLALLARHQNGKGSLAGFRHFSYSDFSAYQQDHFSFFVKTISNRTLPTESINSENIKGHLLNSGDAYFIHDGEEYFNLMPGLNWEYLPGITSFKGADKIKQQAFVGAVTDGKAGFATMDYMLVSKDTAQFIAARKSWFCNEGKVVCLVAVVKANGVDSAYTVMDQCRWKGQVSVDKKAFVTEGDRTLDRLAWVHHRNFLYLPLTNSVAQIRLHAVSGAWASINASESMAPVYDSVFMPVLLHPNVAGGNAFGYLITYCESPPDAKKIAVHAGCTIIRNDSLCQAVSFDNAVLMASFFSAGALVVENNRIVVDQPCLVMIRGDKIYCGDPQQKLGSVNIQFNGKSFAIALPQDGSTARPILLK